VESFLGSAPAPTTVQQPSKMNALDDLNSLQSFTVKRKQPNLLPISIYFN
jgi:hypothetical protein